MTSETNVSVEIFSDKGKGLGAARQIIVDNAQGDYVIFADGDTELSDDFVKEQINYMEKNPKKSCPPLAFPSHFCYALVHHGRGDSSLPRQRDRLCSTRFRSQAHSR